MFFNASIFLFKCLMRMKIRECFDILICKVGMTAHRWYLSIEHLTHGFVFLYLYELSILLFYNIISTIIPIHPIVIQINSLLRIKDYFFFHLMNTKQIQQAIKVCLGTINKAIKQLPMDKRPLITTRLNQVINKYTKQLPNNDYLDKFRKQLEFNLNFIKLSHPNLDFNPVQSSKDTNQKTARNSSQTQSKDEQKKQYQHQLQFINEDKIEIERLQSKDSFDEQLHVQKNIRQQVQFSNWFAGNVDPQHLKRHKELLERQHFSGDYWKDKQKPKSMAKQYLLNALASKGEEGQMPKKDKILKDLKPYEIDQKDEVWQKVKR